MSPDPELIVRSLSGTNEAIDQNFPVATDAAASSLSYVVHPPLASASMTTSSLELRTSSLPFAELQDSMSYDGLYFWNPHALRVSTGVMANELERYLRYEAGADEAERFALACSFAVTALKDLLNKSNLITSDSILACLLKGSFGVASQTKVNELFRGVLRTWPPDKSEQRPSVMTSLVRAAI